MVIETRPLTDAAKESSIATELSRLLADSYATYTKTLHYHWNVRGPHFYSLHQMFEEQYIELQTAIDVIAERVRQLGEDTPPFGSPMDSLSAVPADTGVPEAMDMVRGLIEANEAAGRAARAVVTVAEEQGDVGTADLATERIEAHQKTLWMLRSTLEDG
ncbi:MAG: DNA starvation/stationary phase protection protein [Candidatus Limnocylindrales bacterium]